MTSKIAPVDVQRLLDRASARLVGAGILNQDAWTTSIKEDLTELAYWKGAKIACCPTHVDPTTTAWLWDVVIHEGGGKESRDIGRVLLVMESEWDTTPLKIKEDLQKLFVCRSELRCYAFWCADNATRERTFALIQEAIATNPNVQPDDLYLVAGWSAEPMKFECRLLRQ